MVCPIFRRATAALDTIETNCGEIRLLDALISNSVLSLPGLRVGAINANQMQEDLDSHPTCVSQWS